VPGHSLSETRAWLLLVCGACLKNALRLSLQFLACLLPVMVMLLTSILVALLVRLSPTAVAHKAANMLLLVVLAVLLVAALVPGASAV
jgi:hypothetical protein